MWFYPKWPCVCGRVNPDVGIVSEWFNHPKNISALFLSNATPLSLPICSFSLALSFMFVFSHSLGDQRRLFCESSEFWLLIINKEFADSSLPDWWSSLGGRGECWPQIMASTCGEKHNPTHRWACSSSWPVVKEYHLLILPIKYMKV